MVREKTVSINLKLIITACAAALVIGCGGGGSPPQNATPLTGVFLDSAVSGINYRTQTQSGTTNAAGEFKYITGEQVTFSVGSIVLPSVAAASVITPLDIAGTLRVDDSKVVNLLVFLQSLDADGDPSNGISIPASAITNATTNLDFALSKSAFRTNPLLTTLIAAIPNGVLKSEAATIAHFAQTVGDQKIQVAPVSNAGADQSVSTGAVVTLDGSYSSDANADSLTHNWTLTTKPQGSTAVLSDASAVKPTFTADIAGTYTVSLVVNDGKLNSNSDEVSIEAVNGSISYLGAAAAGEFVNFEVDVNALTYQYEILASQFQQTGLKVSGALTLNPDGSYTQNDGANSHLRISPSGLMLGVVTADLLTPSQRTLFFGADSTLINISEVVGYYNFVSRLCQPYGCIAYYGTMEFLDNGTWTLCSQANLSASPRPVSKLRSNISTDCMEYEVGTYDVSGNYWNLRSNVRTSELDPGSNPEIIGTAMFKKTNDVNTLIIDYRDNRATYPIFEGKGFLVGVTQKTKVLTNTGTTSQYDRFSSNGSYSQITSTDSYKYTVNGQAYTRYENVPWIGFVTNKRDSDSWVSQTGFEIGDTGVRIRIQPGTMGLNIDMPQ